MNVYTHDVGTAQSGQGPVAPLYKTYGKNESKSEWIQHQTVPGWSPTPVLSRLNAA